MGLPTAILADETTATRSPTVLRLAEHTLEIVSDSGEGAQKCGQIFGAVSAKMGNGVWTVEIIPAEIQPPPRTPEGASGNRVRIGSTPDHELGRRRATRRRVQRAGAALAPSARRARRRRDHPRREPLGDASEPRHPALPGDKRSDELSTGNYRIIEVPMEEQCLTIDENPRKGKNMFALGLLAYIYDREPRRASKSRSRTRSARNRKTSTSGTSRCCSSGYAWARGESRFPRRRPDGTLRPAARRHERQRGARARRARIGDGAVRDVSDHAGDVRLALPRRGVREVRRHSASSRGRDRGGGRGDRRVVRRQSRVHRDVGARASRSRRSSSARRS